MQREAAVWETDASSQLTNRHGCSVGQRTRFLSTFCTALHFENLSKRNLKKIHNQPSERESYDLSKLTNTVTFVFVLYLLVFEKLGPLVPLTSGTCFSVPVEGAPLP